MIDLTLPGKSLFSPPKPAPAYVPPPTPRTSTASASAKTAKVPNESAPEVTEAGKTQRKNAATRQGYRGNVRTSGRGLQDEAETKRKTLLGS
jgi:hypothetical protein